MSMLEPIYQAGAWLSNRYAMQKEFAKFSCSDCPIWKSCGDPPRPSCPVRRREISTGHWRTRRRSSGHAMIGI